MYSLLLTIFVGLAAAQPHHESTGPLCYDCGGHGADHEFPACLNHAKQCHGDEVCQFKYGGAHTEIKCHKEHDCNRQISESGRQCASGGYVVHDACQICCYDDACTSATASNFTTSVNVDINHLSVHCPDRCSLDNLAACVSQGHICNEHQYCKVSVDETNGMMHGKCEDVKDLHHCQDEVNKGHCDPGHHNCIMGCCQDDQCVSGAVGGSASSLYELLKGDCQDQLAGDQCASLDATKHLCGDHLAVRVCPKTCGLCTLFNASGCDDTVANNGCQDLVLSEDICHNDLAQHICPKTCNMCDAMLEQKLNDLLTHQQPTIVPPDFGALSCNDLANQDCNVLIAVCPTVNCSDVCSKCMAPTTAAPGDGLNNLQCEDLFGLDCGALDAICPKVNCPNVCDPCFKPIVTVTTAAPVTSTVDMVTGTMATNDNMTVSGDPGAVCADTIQDMNCADVADVCSSPLLVNYCQKYCGICT